MRMRTDKSDVNVASEIFEDIDTPLIVVDPHAGQVERVNSAARSAVHASDGDPLPRRVADSLRLNAEAMKRDGVSVEIAWPAPIGAGLPVIRGTARMARGDGSVIIALRRADLMDAGTARQLDALERAPILVSVIEREGTAVYRNLAARRRHGARGLTIAGRFHDPRDGDNMMTELSQSGHATVTVRIATPGETAQLWHRIEARTTTDPVTGKALIELAEMDVTDAHLAARSLRAARDAAVKSSIAKSDFLARTSHDIRTHMTGVLGVSILLLNKLEDGPNRMLAERLVSSGKQLQHLADEIVDLSRIEAGRLQMEEVEFRPFDLVETIGTTHELTAREKGLGFEVLAGEGANLPRIGDSHRLLQITTNLVSNALRFTDNGSVKVALTAPEGRPLVIEVTDSGIGMTETEQARVFDQYVQASSETARHYGGSGLGLHIVKDLVSAMGGSVRMSSREGRGTTVRVELPLHMARPVRSEVNPLAQLKVLALEDNSTDIQVFDRLLGALGIRARFAHSASEMLSRLAAEPMDLVLLDMAMPGIEADAMLDAVHQIDAERGGAPAQVLAVLSNGMRRDRDAFTERGFDAILTKPLRVEELTACLERLFGSDSPRREVSKSRRGPLRSGT